MEGENVAWKVQRQSGVRELRENDKMEWREKEE